MQLLYMINFATLALVSLLLGETLGLCLGKSKTCASSSKFPFTGYKIESQLDLRTNINTYHLVHCFNNRLSCVIPLNDSIPWTIPLSIQPGEIVTVARKQKFALRPVPIFAPGSLVGALYLTSKDNNSKALPIMAENIMNHWLEVSSRLLFVIHTPILSTPGTDGPTIEELGNGNEAWNKNILATENYQHTKSTIDKEKKGYANLMQKFNSLLTRYWNDWYRIVKSSIKEKSMFLKIYVLSKILPKDQVQTLLGEYEKLMNF